MCGVGSVCVVCGVGSVRVCVESGVCVCVCGGVLLCVEWVFKLLILEQEISANVNISHNEQIKR